VTLDGKRFINWSGKTASLSTGWAVSKGQIGLGSSSASVLYEEAQIRMLTGEAKPTRERK
jgi:hypothetical protein